MYRNVLKTRPEEDSIYIPLETYLKTVPSLQRVTSKVDTNDLMDSQHILNTSHFGRFYDHIKSVSNMHGYMEKSTFVDFLCLVSKCISVTDRLSDSEHSDD
jgi:thioredoxin-related protein